MPVSGVLTAPTLHNRGYTGTGPADFAYEEGSDNGNTNFVRSAASLTGSQGKGILGGGLDQITQGVNATAPVLDFLTKLVKGDQGDIAEATQPGVDNITQQFDQIRNMVSMQPRGGGKASVLAEAPFKKSAAIQRMGGDMRRGAAGDVSNLATNLAGIGLAESDLGAGLEKSAADITLRKMGLDYGQPSALEQIIGGITAFI